MWDKVIIWIGRLAAPIIGSFLWLTMECVPVGMDDFGIYFECIAGSGGDQVTAYHSGGYGKE